MPLEPSPNIPGLVLGCVDAVDGGCLMVIQHDDEPHCGEVVLIDGDRIRLAGARLDGAAVDQAIALLVEVRGRMAQA